jgi:hypothetical protein
VKVLWHPITGVFVRSYFLQEVQVDSWKIYQANEHSFSITHEQTCDLLSSFLFHQATPCVLLANPEHMQTYWQCRTASNRWICCNDKFQAAQLLSFRAFQNSTNKPATFQSNDTNYHFNLEDGRGMLHAWECWEIWTEFWSGNLKVTDHLEDPGVDGTIL